MSVFGSLAHASARERERASVDGRVRAHVCVCVRASVFLSVSVRVCVCLSERNYSLVSVHIVLHDTFEITLQATASLQTTPSMP